MTEPRPADAGSSDLAPPQVASDVYDDEYFRHGCAGSEEWEASGGREFAGVYVGALRRAKLQPSEVLVDLGTGRGEMLVAALSEGASRAIGVEYSSSAVALAEHTIELHGVGDRARVILSDARRSPVPDTTADLVTMLDVAEHLNADELLATLREAHRILKPGGRLLIHTMPNRSIYSVTCRLQRWWPGRTGWPPDPRNDYEREMHVNEQTLTSLRRSLRRAGFKTPQLELGQWIYTSHVPDERARRLYHRLARLPLLARFGVADIWAFAVRSR